MMEAVFPVVSVANCEVISCAIQSNDQFFIALEFQLHMPGDSANFRDIVQYLMPACKTAIAKDR